MVEFEYLSEDILVKYIKKDLPDLSNDRCKRLIGYCENDYSSILLEIDKLKQAQKSINKNTNDLFDSLVESGVIRVPPKDAIFDFIDAVLKNKRTLAYELLAEAYASGEYTLNLLSNLFNNAKYVLQLQAYRGTGKVTDVTGLTPFQIKLATVRKGTYSAKQLVELMNLSREAEVGIKTGKIDDNIAVEYVLAQFWR